jgi:hypothetical protein
MSMPPEDSRQAPDEDASGEMKPKQTSIGVPMNVYDYLDDATIDELGKHLDADSDIESFNAWLSECVEGGNMPRIVADHISRWTQLKAHADQHVLDYQAYTVDRLDEWEPLGLVPPSSSMFGTSQPVLSMKQPRNAPCRCGSGLKFKRCHGAPATPRSPF